MPKANPQSELQQPTECVADMLHEPSAMSSDVDAALATFASELIQEPSQDLKVLTRQVRRLHSDFLKSTMNAIDYGNQAGCLLHLAKPQLKGHFDRFLKKAFEGGHSPVGVRQCYRYMALAKKLCAKLGHDYSKFAGPGLTRVSETPGFAALGVASLRQMLLSDRSKLADTETSGNGDHPSDPSIRHVRRQKKDGDGDEESSSIDVPATDVEGKDRHWYDECLAPPEIVALVLGVLNAIDLDPASNPGEPQVPASLHYQEVEDGLAAGNPWSGNLFLHPPHGSCAAWTNRLVHDFDKGKVASAIALVPARIAEDWFRLLAGVASVFAIWNGQLSFPSPHDRDVMNVAKEPMAIVYLSHETGIERFTDKFGNRADLYQPFRISE